MPLVPGLDLLAGSVAPGMALCSAPVPMAFGLYSDPDHSIRCWLTYPLALVLAPWVAESLTVPVSPAVAPVVPSVTDAAPVPTKARQAAKTSGNRKALDKTPRRRSPKTTTAAAQ
ncbi:MAG: hypothetical protein MH252_06175 [Thermosynechococcaceae cyanobacterium MS004]|nr:hypothetical protein [Thermosynechococcaceae cyanobacterium MS004]